MFFIDYYELLHLVICFIQLVICLFYCIRERTEKRHLQFVLSEEVKRIYGQGQAPLAFCTTDFFLSTVLEPFIALLQTRPAYAPTGSHLYRST